MSPQTDLLTHIFPGMEVYDLEDNKVGTVKAVSLPEGVLADIDALNLDDGTLKRIVATLNSVANVPLEEQARFSQDGFVRLDTGRFRADRYILPEHIRSVSADRVRLSVRYNELP